MSEENIRILAQFGEAYKRGWEGIIPLLHPDFEFHEPPEQPGPTVFRGIEEARAGFATWAGTWLEQRSEIKGFEELRDGRILVFSRERLIGRNDIRVEQDSTSIFTFKDGKVLRWQVFWEPSNALEAAGLPPDEFSP